MRDVVIAADYMIQVPVTAASRRPDKQSRSIAIEVNATHERRMIVSRSIIAGCADATADTGSHTAGTGRKDLVWVNLKI